MQADACEVRTDGQQLLRIWLSPSFPVGAYAYSHGLEAAVARGLIPSRDNLQAWLAALLRQGSVRTDLVLLAAAYTAASEPDSQVPRDDPSPLQSTLSDINALALALQPSAERHLETAQQGGSFVATCLAAWPCPALVALRAANPHEIAYPIAIGVAAAGHDIGLAGTVDAAALAFVQSLISAAIRLSVIGQTDGQRVIAALLADIAAATGFAATATLDDLGAACFSSDLASLEHETIGTRLFRS